MLLLFFSILTLFQNSGSKGCQENEIFFLENNRMFLISSEKIVHDITGVHEIELSFYHLGLADFENNLWSQIKNQDKVPTSELEHHSL